jgi:hypothetical protein
MAMSGVTPMFWHLGWSGWYLGVEAVVCVVLYFGLRRRFGRLRWPSME